MSCGENARSFIGGEFIVSEQKKILLIASSVEEAQGDLGKIFSPEEVLLFDNLSEAFYRTDLKPGKGIFISGSREKELYELSRTDKVAVLDILPISVVVLDQDQRIVWYNKRFSNRFGGKESPQESAEEQSRDSQTLVNGSFYKVLGNPQITGPDYSPLHTVRTTQKATQTGLRTPKNEFYQMDVMPFPHPKGKKNYLLVGIRDISDAKHSEQRLDALLKAGLELPDLTSDQLQEMTIEDRISILKSNIMRNTMELLNYDVVEIRLLATDTAVLEPLLAYGMNEEAVQRKLFARPEGNGITGYVAYSGKSYLCDDTSEDPYYLSGSIDAKSSLTVPLIYHEEVIGTFNVESPESNAFSERDLRFLEIFASNVAAAIHTLDLLTAEKWGTASASVEAIHSAVALPVDLILQDAIYVLSHHHDLEPDMLERLRRIQAKAREIKAVIQKVGETMSPAQAHPFPPKEKHPLLRGSNILVVDADESVLIAANEMLSRYGCNVESAPKAEEALMMVENSHYDAIISDIRLADCSGYQLLLKLRDIMDVSPIPLILMTGFGYDPGHVVVKARQEGVDTFLYKPFLLDQLIKNIETVIRRNRRSER